MGMVRATLINVLDMHHCNQSQGIMNPCKSVVGKNTQYRTKEPQF